jgi:hypothetical protein
MGFDEDVDGDLGPQDEYALEEIRTVFTTQEPLVKDAGFPNLIDPQEMRVVLDDGIGEATDRTLC